MDADVLPNGAIAQLGERLICIQEVVGSIPSGSTRYTGLVEIKVPTYKSVIYFTS